MSTDRQQPPVRITIDPNDSLPVILQQLREHGGKSVVIDIPDHCPVLLTATEFRTMKELAERERISLSLRTDDRLRHQLSSMFGIKNVGDAGAQSPNDGWRPPPTMLGSPRAFGTWNKNDDEDDGIVELEPGTRSRRRRRGEVIETNTYTKRSDDDEGISSLEYLNEPKELLTAKNIGRIVGVLLVVALLLAAAGWYYMPAVTVDATLRRQDVSNQLLYSVAAPGAQLPSDIAFTADATQGSATVNFTITIPTTGVERTPEGTASGSALLRNPGEAPVTVPAGTELSVYAGPTFTTNEAVEVPPAANGVAGEASVGVTATAPGSAGNVEAGLLTGRLADLGVFYSNRETPIEGGTDIEVMVVAQEDIDRLREEVATNLDRAAAEGWIAQLPEGQSVVVPSVDTGEPTYEITAQVGEKLDEITATGTVDATGLVFDAATVEQQTLEFFRTALQEEVPEGYALDPESVTLSEPAVIAEAPDNVQYQVEASGLAHAVYDESVLEDLSEDLAGESWDGAESTLAGVEAFESWEMSTSPGWWARRMPQTGDRITINVEQAPAASDAGEPAPSPSPGEGDGS
ncbi:MAG TPA: baseplate J/gp47 family protein [Thermomicrobiales bacterium]|nr:baseplate J/gp47 family protein [Thermomicrobiales bacterium]